MESGKKNRGRKFDDKGRRKRPMAMSGRGLKLLLDLRNKRFKKKKGGKA